MLVLRTLVLVALVRFKVVMVVSELVVIMVPLPEGPWRHTNSFIEVTFAGTLAVHARLKVLYGVASSTVTAEG